MPINILAIERITLMKTRLIKIIFFAIVIIILGICFLSTNPGQDYVYAATNTISLKDYGAVGDGIADDYTALSNAISDAISGNKILKVPSGTYYSSKMLSIDGPIQIVGDKDSICKIVFRDKVEYGNKPQYWQRGLFTITGNEIKLENITLQYESNKSTPYNRTMSTKEGEGVLLSVVDSSNITLENSRFIVSGSQNPSVTCVWFKSETKDIQNVVVNNCIFDHQSASTVSGSLWISANDNSSTVLKNIYVKNCTFNEYAHDETMSIWGYQISTAEFSANTFNYLGTSTFVDTFVAVGAYNNATLFSNVKFSKNIFNITNNVKTALQIGNIPANSSVCVYGNTVNATLPSDVDFCCFGLFDCGKAILTNNNCNITGGNSVSFVLFDRKGNININNSKVIADKCNKFLLIRSRYSQNQVGAALSISNSNFDICATTHDSKMPIVQYPLDSSLKINNTTFSTAKSSIHELVFQALTSPQYNSGTGSIELSSVTTDADVYFAFKDIENREISLKNTDLNNMYCIFERPGTKVNKFEISGCDIDHFYINSKEESLSALTNYANSFTLQ